MGDILNALVLGATGLALVPMLPPLFAPKEDQITNVRVILGQGVESPLQADGNVPGVALWDRFGNPIGTKFGEARIAHEGDSIDIPVAPNPGVGNVPAEYISITNGGDDAICVSGFTITFADGGRAAWTADVAAACSLSGLNAFVAPSSRKMVIDQETNTTPWCVWIDRNKSGGIPHQGFGVHIPDFGNALTETQAAAYRGNQDLMCKSGPRFRMYEQLRSEDPILTFHPPISLNPDGTDVDPDLIIENPGTPAIQDRFALQIACAGKQQPTNCGDLPTPQPFKTGIFRRVETTLTPVRRSQQRHLPDSVTDLSTTDATLIASQSSIPTSSLDSDHNFMISGPGTSILANSTNESRNLAQSLFDGQLIISSQNFHSAQTICQHPNSIGPSFATLSDGTFCDMAQKKVYPICMPNQESTSRTTNATGVEGCCFDARLEALRGCSGDGDDLASQDSGFNGTGMLFALESSTSNSYASVKYW